MHDPGNVYLIGYAFLFVLVGTTLYFAKRALKGRGETTQLTTTPIIACASVAAALIGAGLAKVTVFADYYTTHSIYTPA
jgi:hypothetical protein